ncbi:Alpha-MPP [Aphelenchoides fujianensis]|nr:Alpha-MPP [Aphelenchoides fujianensis]
MANLLRHRLPLEVLRRRASDSARSAVERLHRHYLTIPLTDPLPGYERLAYIDPKSVKLFDAKMTTLDNGLRVDILRIIADTVHRPVFSALSVDYAKQVIKYENEAARKDPEPEQRLIDWAHTAAFRGNTLGFSKYCDTKGVDEVDVKHLYSFLSQYHTPDRIVVGAVGVNHERLVDWAQNLFDPQDTRWARDPSLIAGQLPPVDRSLAQYTGGEYREERDLSKMARGPHPFPNLSHLMLGFESVSVRHDDFIAFCVLQSLLGGGGSFSAGGPGKGMYTRLYTDVMNHFHWMYNATAFNQSYADGGLFCIRASQPPENMLKSAKILLSEFLRLNEIDVSEAELQRAKTQLMMNLELRPVMFEDMVRQVLAHNERKKPQEYLKKIDAVRPVDIRRVTERMLQTKPTVVGYGDLRGLPSYENFDRAVVERSPRLLEPTRSIVFG